MSWNLISVEVPSGSDLSDSELESLSGELGFRIFPIKKIYIYDAKGKLFDEYDPVELRENDSRSSLYLTEVKSNLIVLPLNFIKFFNDNPLSIIAGASLDDIDSGDYFYLNYDGIWAYGSDSGAIALGLSNLEVQPMNIVIKIEEEREAEE